MKTTINQIKQRLQLLEGADITEEWQVNQVLGEKQALEWVLSLEDKA